MKNTVNSGERIWGSRKGYKEGGEGPAKCEQEVWDSNGTSGYTQVV